MSSIPKPTPDPWAAAVEALDKAMSEDCHARRISYYRRYASVGLRAALPHLLEAVVENIYREVWHALCIKQSDGTVVNVRPDQLLAALQQAAARL